MNNSMFNPKSNKGTPFAYSVLGGLDKVQLMAGGVKGNFKASLIERVGDPSQRLASDFVNLPSDPDHIFGFVSQHGPVGIKAAPGAPFFMSFENFTEAQEELRKLWKSRCTSSMLDVKAGSVRFSRDGITYVAPDLLTYLKFDLLASPAERTRICLRADCPHPFFLAADMKRKFCSEECSADRKREIKRDWARKQVSTTADAVKAVKKGRTKHGL